MKKIISLLSALIISVVSFAGISNAADSKKPIVIPTHNWSSQIVMAYVIGGIFESMGNNVKYVNADSQAVYESIRIGDVTLSHEVWESAFGKSFTTYLSTPGGKIFSPGYFISLLVPNIFNVFIIILLWPYYTENELTIPLNQNILCH